MMTATRPHSFRSILQLLGHALCATLNSGWTGLPLLLCAVVLDSLVTSHTLTLGLSGAHTVGFGIGALCIVIGLSIHADTRPTAWADILWLVLSGVLINALRGGLATHFNQAFTPATQSLSVSLLITVGCSLSALWLFQALYLHRARFDSLAKQALLLSLGLIALRLSYLGLPELIFEEAYYWDYAQHFDYGYLDHPLITACLIKLSTWLLDNQVFAVRLPAFLCWFVTAYFTARLVRDMLGETEAAVAWALTAALPAFFFFGFFMSPDAPLTACWAASLYFAYQAFVCQKSHAWIALGISLGLGMSSKYTIVLLGLGLVLLMTLVPAYRFWWKRKEPYLALFITLLLFSPVILWNAQHDWASFTFQSGERARSGFVFSTPRFLANILLFATPMALVSCWQTYKHRAYFSQWLPAHLSPSVLWQVTFLGALPILIFGVFSVARTSKLNWTGPAWLAFIPLFALLICRTEQTNATLHWLHRAWRGMLALLLLCYALGLHYLAIGFPGVPYPHNLHLLGWQPIGMAIEQRYQAARANSHVTILVVGLDRNKLASGLAFYRGLAESQLKPSPATQQTQAALTTSSQNMFGENGLMFGWWFHPQDYRGATLLVVSEDRDDLDGPLIKQHSLTQGAIETLPLVKNQQSVGALYVRFIYDYQP